MTGFHIRPGSRADLSMLREVYRRASLSNSGDVAQLLAHPEVLLLTDDGVNEGRTRVATRMPDHIVGFVTTRRTGRVLELEDLFVDPDWMRRGVGRALVRDVVSLALQDNLYRVEVTANPHAFSFYENVGFVHDGDVDTPFGSGSRMHLDIAGGRGAA
jgi:GNAT superfamily N-acetyltransferase